MPSSREFERFALDQLAPAGDVSSRRMFGGVGIYLDGCFIALIAPHEGALYLKVDDPNRARFERAGSEPFRPFRDRSTTMSFWRVPEEILEDSATLVEWARESLAVARRARRRAR